MYGPFKSPHAVGIGAAPVCGCIEGYYELKTPPDQEVVRI